MMGVFYDFRLCFKCDSLMFRLSILGLCRKKWLSLVLTLHHYIQPTINQSTSARTRCPTKFKASLDEGGTITRNRCSCVEQSGVREGHGQTGSELFIMRQRQQKFEEILEQMKMTLDRMASTK